MNVITTYMSGLMNNMLSFGEERLNLEMLESNTLRMIPADPSTIEAARLAVSDKILGPGARTRSGTSADWLIGNPIGQRLVPPASFFSRAENTLI